MNCNSTTSSQFINVMIGTAGHIDHGKTQLVKCLTGCDTDTLKEEKERGMSIDLGFAPCKLQADMSVGIVDVPGHEKFIRNMVAGATAIDIVLFVIAADDGIMPQTREHFDIINILGIKKGLAAITKIDAVEKDRAKEVIMEVKEYFTGTSFEGCPVLPVSSITGEGFDEFYSALNKVVRETKRRDTGGIFRMNIERKFLVKGSGLVVTGIPVSGKVVLGDTVELFPHKTKVHVRKLQVFGRDNHEGRAGECVALNITGTEHDNIERGNVLAASGYYEPVKFVTARLNLLRSWPQPLKNGMKVSFYTGTVEVPGKVILLDKEILEPGEAALVQIRLDKPVIIMPLDKYIIRFLSPVITIGGGIIIGSQKVRLKRLRPWIIENIIKEEQAIHNPGNFVSYIIETAPPAWITKTELLKKAKLPAEKAEDVLNSLIKECKIRPFDKGKKYIHKLKYESEKDKFINILKAYHSHNPLDTGISRIGLRKELNCDAELFNELAAALINEKAILEENNKLRLTGHQIKLDAGADQLKQKLIKLYLEAGYSTPRQDELAERLSEQVIKIDEMMKLIFDEKVLVKLPQNVVMHNKFVAEAKDIVIKHIQKNGGLDSALFKTMIGSSRKYALALLDYFDEQGITIRSGNIRQLKGV